MTAAAQARVAQWGPSARDSTTEPSGFESAHADGRHADAFDVRQANALGQASAAGVWPSGHARLDAALPGGGWPWGALVQVLQSHPMQRVWSLLAPGLAGVLRAQTGPLVLVNPPAEPFGPALALQGVPAQRLLWVRTPDAASALWATEQALRCPQVLAVLAWLPAARADALRRLQVAARGGGGRGRGLFAFGPAPVAGQAGESSSPAVLRLQVLDAEAGATARAAWGVRILKRRGPPLDQVLWLNHATKVPDTPYLIAQAAIKNIAIQVSAPHQAVGG